MRNLVPFAQFKKREKHPWRSITFSKLTYTYYWMHNPVSDNSLLGGIIGLASCKSGGNSGETNEERVWMWKAMKNQLEWEEPPRWGSVNFLWLALWGTNWEGANFFQKKIVGSVTGGRYDFSLLWKKIPMKLNFELFQI